MSPTADRQNTPTALPTHEFHDIQEFRDLILTLNGHPRYQLALLQLSAKYQPVIASATANGSLSEHPEILAEVTQILDQTPTPLREVRTQLEAACRAYDRRMENQRKPQPPITLDYDTIRCVYERTNHTFRRLEPITLTPGQQLRIQHTKYYPLHYAKVNSSPEDAGACTVDFRTKGPVSLVVTATRPTHDTVRIQMEVNPKSGAWEEYVDIQVNTDLPCLTGAVTPNPHNEEDDEEFRTIHKAPAVNAHYTPRYGNRSRLVLWSVAKHPHGYRPFAFT